MSCRLPALPFLPVINSKHNVNGLGICSEAVSRRAARLLGLATLPSHCQVIVSLCLFRIDLDGVLCPTTQDGMPSTTNRRNRSQARLQAGFPAARSIVSRIQQLGRYQRVKRGWKLTAGRDISHDRPVRPASAFRPSNPAFATPGRGCEGRLRNSRRWPADKTRAPISWPRSPGGAGAFSGGWGPGTASLEAATLGLGLYGKRRGVCAGAETRAETYKRRNSWPEQSSTSTAARR